MTHWLRSLVNLQEAPVHGRGRVCWCCVSSKRTVRTVSWMMKNVGQPLSRRVETQWGHQEPWGDERTWLTPPLVSPDLPVWALILICLAGLLVLITGLICCLLVSHDVLLVFLLLGCKTSLYIKNTHPFLGICFADVFSQSVCGLPSPSLHESLGKCKWQSSWDYTILENGFN